MEKNKVTLDQLYSNKVDQFVNELKSNNLDSYFLSSLDSPESKRTPSGRVRISCSTFT